MGACYWAGVLLVCVLIVCVNTLVVGKINVVTLGICIDGQVVLAARVGQGSCLSLTLGCGSTTFLISHFF